MHFSQDLIAFVAATLFTSSLSSPVTLTKPHHCNDYTTGPNTDCWNELKVDDYMTKWEASNYPTTCIKGDVWSTCFDRSATSNLKQDCTKINSTATCTPFNPKEHYLSPQWYYGSYNTWSINNFFTGWFNTVSLINERYPEIIPQYAAPAGDDVFINSKTNGQISIDIALRNLIQRVPGTQTLALIHLTNLNPSNVTYDSNNIDTADPPIAAALMSRLKELLLYVESDLPAFLEMAANGIFSEALVRPAQLAGTSSEDTNIQDAYYAMNAGASPYKWDTASLTDSG
ncbi:MAG: hypothetical protein Q9168_003409 [Polycauliona sp. 1 TL-2023]